MINLLADLHMFSPKTPKKIEKDMLHDSIRDTMVPAELVANIENHFVSLCGTE